MMTYLMSSFSCAILKDRILEGWVAAECNGTRHGLALALSVFSMAIILFFGVFSSLFFNKFDVFSWNQDHQAHGRVELWYFLAHVFLSMTFTIVRTIPSSSVAVRVVNLGVIACLFINQVLSVVVSGISFCF